MLFLRVSYSNLKFLLISGHQNPLKDLVEPKSEPCVDDEEMSEEQQCSKCGQYYFGHVTQCGCENVEKVEKELQLRECLECGKKFKRILKFRQHLQESPSCNGNFKSNRMFKKEDTQEEVLIL